MATPMACNAVTCAGLCCAGFTLLAATAVLGFALPPQLQPQRDQFTALFRDYGGGGEGGGDGARASSSSWGAPSELFSKMHKTWKEMPDVPIGIDPELPPSIEDKLDAVEPQGGPESWGIDRIDQRATPLDHAYTPKYLGDGIHVFVLDTGVYDDHVEFGTRIGLGANCVDVGAGKDCDPALPTDDKNGHGTHVACTAASGPYGVAPHAVVHPVKVLGDDGAGGVGGVIKGMEWVGRLVKGQRWEGKAVAVMSLGTPLSRALNENADALVHAGVPVVVAAGNQGADACEYSPASADAVISVGATNAKDRLPSFTNWGPCVDILAPGSSINSCSIKHDSGDTRKSGTSMAAPHVAGVVAQLLQQAMAEEGRRLDPAAVRERLLAIAAKNEVVIKDGQKKSTVTALLQIPALSGAQTAKPLATTSQLWLVAIGALGMCVCACACALKAWLDRDKDEGEEKLELA